MRINGSKNDSFTSDDVSRNTPLRTLVWHIPGSSIDMLLSSRDDDEQRLGEGMARGCAWGGGVAKGCRERG